MGRSSALIWSPWQWLNLACLLATWKYADNLEAASRHTINSSFPGNRIWCTTAMYSQLSCLTPQDLQSVNQKDRKHQVTRCPHGEVPFHIKTQPFFAYLSQYLNIPWMRTLTCVSHSFYHCPLSFTLPVSHISISCLAQKHCDTHLLAILLSQFMEGWKHVMACRGSVVN